MRLDTRHLRSLGAHHEQTVLVLMLERVVPGELSRRYPIAVVGI
jgi:hypothetical protein